MDKLVSIRANVFYFKKRKETIDEQDTMLKHHELIFVIEKEHYKKEKDGSVLKVDSKFEQTKFVIPSESYLEMIELLKKLYDIDESTVHLKPESESQTSA